jgi:hypothetical protein
MMRAPKISTLFWDGIDRFTLLDSAARPIRRTHVTHYCILSRDAHEPEMRHRDAGDPSMDQQAFDRLTRLFGQARTRRESIGALLGVAIAGFAEHSAGAKSGGKRRGRRENDERGHDKSRAKRKPAHDEQVAPGCYSGTPCVLGKGKNNFQCDLSGMDLSGKNLSGSNLSKANFAGAVVKNANLSKSTLSEACFLGADLTDANLKGANTSGAIFCRTVMPDGSVNDSGCDKGTTCCPTCLALGERGCRAGIPCCAGVCGGDDGNVCVCPSGTEECNGACRDLQSDRKHCGACGHRCSGNETCSGGRCACGPGNVICNDVCVSGACCNGGSGLTCSGGTTCCAPNGCKNLQSDANNCGVCGLKCTLPEADGCTDGTCSCGSGPACIGGQVCDGGNCRCPDGQELCNGACQTTAQPGEGCGACGTACPDKEICAGDPKECQCGG